MSELIQINSYGKRDIKGKLPKIFEMKKIYDIVLVAKTLRHEQLCPLKRT